LQYFAYLRKSTKYCHKHNSTMVSDASPGTATPKMNCQQRLNGGTDWTAAKDG
jgi:hypothetical protein